MISNRNIINLILEIKKQVLQPYHCIIDSLFLIERFYNVKKTVKKTDQPWYTHSDKLEYSVWYTWNGVWISFIHVNSIH